jgi:hypothetical protein
VAGFQGFAVRPGALETADLTLATPDFDHVPLKEHRRLMYCSVVTVTLQAARPHNVVMVIKKVGEID